MCRIYVCVCARECRYLRRPEGVRSPSARITGSCEPPSVVLGTKLKSSVRAASVLSPSLHSLGLQI